MPINPMQRWHGIMFVALMLVLSGCGNSDQGSLATAGPQITVYKSPTCSCCKLWVDHLQANGFKVQIEERDNVMPVKQELGIPAGMGSCHTAVVDGYIIEGHVPAADIQRLLNERPKARGLAVPGMPIGSPGMEQGDRRDPYQVLLFTEDKTATQVFSSYPD